MSIENQDVGLKDVREQIRLKRFSQQCMKKYYIEAHNGVKTATGRFNDELAIELNYFYLTTAKKNSL